MPLIGSLLPSEAGGMKRIVILGGGTGGTLVANRLRRAYPLQPDFAKAHWYCGIGLDATPHPTGLISKATVAL